MELETFENQISCCRCQIIQLVCMQKSISIHSYIHSFINSLFVFGRWLGEFNICAFQYTSAGQGGFDGKFMRTAGEMNHSGNDSGGTKRKHDEVDAENDRVMVDVSDAAPKQQKRLRKLFPPVEKAVATAIAAAKVELSKVPDDLSCQIGHSYKRTLEIRLNHLVVFLAESVADAETVTSIKAEDLPKAVKASAKKSASGESALSSSGSSKASSVSTDASAAPGSAISVYLRGYHTDAGQRAPTVSDMSKLAAFKEIVYILDNLMNAVDGAQLMLWVKKIEDGLAAMKQVKADGPTVAPKNDSPKGSQKEL